MQDEGGPTLQLTASFIGGIIALVVLVLVVSQPGLLESGPAYETARVAATPTSVDFQLPPLPPPDVTLYYLVDTASEAAALRAKAQQDAATRRASGQPLGAQVQPLIGYSAEREMQLRADIAARQQLQNFFGVKYEVVDLRGQ